MADRKLTVDILANDRGFGGTMASAGKSLAGFGALALGAAGGAAIIGAKVYDMGLKLESMDAKAKTVFEGSLGSVQKWADNVAGSMGLTSREAVGLATNMADLLKPMGFTAEQAAAMSTNTTDLAGALAAWSGGTVDAAGAADVLTKAMLGERDGLKALGISISEADVQARLAAKGQLELTGAALEQAKALATQELILEKSTDAQKAWADGTFDAIKRQNEMKASIGQAKEALVMALMPALSGVADLISTKVVPFVNGLTEAFQEGGLGAAWDYVVEGWRNAWPQIQQFLGDTASALWTWIQDVTPVVLEQMGEWLQALGGWIVDTAAPQLWEWIKQLADAFWEWLKDVTPPALAQLGEWLAALGEWMLNTGLPALGEWLAAMADKLWEWIKDATPPMLAQLGEWLAQLGGWLVGTAIPAAAEWLAKMGLELVEWILESTPKMLAQVASWLNSLTAWIVTEGLPKLAVEMAKLGAELVKWIVDKTPEAVAKLGELVGQLVSWVFTSGIPLLGETLIALGKAAINGLWDGMKAVWELLKNFWLVDLGKKITGAIGDLSELLLDIGKAIIQSLWDGMKAVWEEVSGWLSGIGGKIKSLKGPIEKDRVLLYDEGLAIMDGLHAGLVAGWEDKVRPMLAGLGSQMINEVSTASDLMLRGGVMRFPSTMAGGASNLPSTLAPGALGASALPPTQQLYPNTQYVSSRSMAISITVNAGVGDPVEIGGVVSRVLGEHIRANGPPDWLVSEAA